MTISNTTEDAILKLVYQAAAWANYADNAAATPQTAVDNALHVADPLDAGTMTTSETTYTSYTRVAVTRSSLVAGWIQPASGSISPGSNIDFPAGTGGAGTISNWSTGKTGGAAAAILWTGSVSPTIAAGSGVTPRLTTASVITLD
jgi:hypothetical protein